MAGLGAFSRGLRGWPTVLVQVDGEGNPQQILHGPAGHRRNRFVLVEPLVFGIVLLENLLWCQAAFALGGTFFSVFIPMAYARFGPTGSSASLRKVFPVTRLRAATLSHVGDGNAAERATKLVSVAALRPHPAHPRCGRRLREIATSVDVSVRSR
jgi:hypothetical protein